jgi:hypothetical protein
LPLFGVCSSPSFASPLLLLMRFFCLSVLVSLTLLAGCQSETARNTRETPTAVASPAVAAASVPADVGAVGAPDSAAADSVGDALLARAALADTSRATGFYDAFGRYLAGLPARPDAPLVDTLLKSPRWQVFRRAIGPKRSYDRTRVQPIRRWATRQLDSAAQARPVVFYPFSGPDLLNVHTYFPQAETYVMVGLEPVGALPTPGVLAQPELFKTVQNSLYSVLNFSFFRTISMAADLKTQELDGTLPVLLLFATRTGHRVIDVQLVHLSPEGVLADGAAVPDSRQVPGSRLLLADSTGRHQTVYYFSADISDGKLAANPALLAFAKSLGTVSTFVKSASYLMHKRYFSKIRNIVLNQSQLLLQDDSGIAYDFFDDGRWNITHFGHYTKPIPLFEAHYQHDLYTAYRDSVHRPKPLPFGTGYNHRANESNLMLALRKAR